jgi:ketosteroid isomerase-like protein
MSELELARQGLSAWQRGDFEVLEMLLAPEATWRAVEPGEWDCESRDAILRTLRARFEEGFTRGEFELIEASGGAVVLVSHPAEIGGDQWPEETAIALTFRGGKVVAMQDYASVADALAASNHG